MTTQDQTTQLTKEETKPPEPLYSDAYDPNSSEGNDFTAKILTKPDEDKTSKSRAPSGLAASAPQNEARKKVDRALFNAYLKRLEILLAEVAHSADGMSLTEIIKISEAYTVSIRSERSYRFFISGIVLIIRNNYESLKEPSRSSRLLSIVKKFSGSSRGMKEYDAFMRACYMAGLSALNKS